MKLFNKKHFYFINLLFLTLSLSSASDSNFKITNNTGKKIYISIGNGKFSPMMMSFLAVLPNETYANNLDMTLKPDILLSTQVPETDKTTVLDLQFNNAKKIFLNVSSSDKYFKDGLEVKAQLALLSSNISNKDIVQKSVTYKKESSQKNNRPWYNLLRELSRYEVNIKTKPDVEPEITLGFKKGELISENDVFSAITKLLNRLKQLNSFWNPKTGSFVKQNIINKDEAKEVNDNLYEAGAGLYYKLSDKAKGNEQASKKIAEVKAVLVDMM